jgi:hypothetical protein
MLNNKYAEKRIERGIGTGKQVVGKQATGKIQNFLTKFIGTNISLVERK